MNKILNINLGGYALTIDEDAHDYLAAYLENIGKRFSESDGRDEIMRDVEARIGELISHGMGTRSIVMLPDVQIAVEIMGKPEDFGGEPESGGQQSGSGTSILGQAVRTGKKLFRDEQDMVLGGVCSGLSAYFGFQDTVWMRLIFVFLALVTTGFWVVIYLVLWMILPLARTTNERLAMRGEAINIDNIAKEFEQGTERMGSRVGPAARNVSSGCFLVFGKLFAAFLILMGVILVFSLGSAWIGGIVGFISIHPYLSYFSPFSMPTTYFGFVCAFLLLGLPVVGICLLFARMIFRFNLSSWITTGMLTTWFVSLISVIILVASGIGAYRQSSTVAVNEDLSAIPSDTLRIEWAGIEEDDYDGHWWHDEGVKIRDGRVEVNGPLDVRIRKSESGVFECARLITARGASYTNAQQHASEVLFPLEIVGNTIRIPTKIVMQEGKKYHLQSSKINLSIPIGKYVVFGKVINRYVRGDVAYTHSNEGAYISDYPDKVFKMTQNGLVCTDCPNFGDRDFHSDHNYEDFTFEGNFDVEIREGEQFSTEITGSEAFKNTLEMTHSHDDVSFIQSGQGPQGGAKIRIITPNLRSLKLEKCPNVVIRGFEQHEMRISGRKGTAIKADMDVSYLDVFLDGAASLDLDGQGNRLSAKLSNGAIINAGNWRTDEVDVTAVDGSKGRVYGAGNVQIRNDGSSSVKADGQ